MAHEAAAGAKARKESGVIRAGGFPEANLLPVDPDSPPSELGFNFAPTVAAFRKIDDVN
jgi:hypothetical protein